MRFWKVAISLLVSGAHPFPGRRPKGDPHLIADDSTETLNLSRSSASRPDTLPHVGLIRRDDQYVRQCKQTATVTITKYALVKPASSTIYMSITETTIIFQPITDTQKFHGALHPNLAPVFANSSTKALKTNATDRILDIANTTAIKPINRRNSTAHHFTHHFLPQGFAHTITGVPISSKTVVNPAGTSPARICAMPTCGERGAKFTQFNNPFSGDYSSNYDSFDLKHFRNDKKPVKSGIIETIHLNTDARNETFSHTALEFRTFLYACQDGTYTFTSQYSDDATLMWFGEAGFANSTRENADIRQFYYGNNSEMSVQKEIMAGTYYPIRILWGNTEGSGFLSLGIYGPNGIELTNSSSTNETSSFLITEACDT